MKWLIAILIFSILVLVHEFGHFLVAKLSGVEVEEFSMGFGPRLLSAKWHGTRYSLKLLLFGGSCRMKSMLDDYDGDDASIPDKPEEGTFEAASCGRRAAILFAGPFFNFLLAFICAIIVIGGVGYDPAEVLSVQKGSAAAEAGLKKGDVITSFMDSRVDIGRDLSAWFTFHKLSKNSDVTISYTRNGKRYETNFTPDVTRRYAVGITYQPDSSKAEIESVQSGSPLDKAGAEAGDVITAIDGTKIASGKDLSDYFKAHPLTKDALKITLKRSGTTREVTVKPAMNENVTLGFSYNLGRTKTSPIGVLKYSVIEIRYWIVNTVKSVAGMFTGLFTVNDLAGPVGVVDMVGRTYEATKSDGAMMTFMNMLNMIILLSANLGVMNLLPIPGLDGGRLVGVIVEAVSGHKINWKVENAITTVFAVALMVLMVYVMYHDIVRMIS